MTDPSTSAVPQEDAAAITRASGSNLAFAFGCLPRQRRRDMVTFYAYCRVVDDIADDPAMERGVKQHRLDHWRAVVDGASSPTAPLEGELMEMLERYPGIERRHLLEIIDGMEMDLDTVRYSTYAELERYCYRVASAVGLVSIEIFGCRDPMAKVYAEELGHALQLTNILRDVGQDLASEDRIYLPQEDLDRFGVTEAALRRGGDPGPGFAELMRFEADRAGARYEAARKSFPDGDRKALKASELMRRIYGALLQQMRDDGFRVLEKRYRLPAWKKLGYLLGSILTP